MFDKFKVKKPQRSTLSLSHKHETTVNIGDINALHWNWCFPGDRFKIKYSFLCKFSPMLAPNFSRMRIKSEVFYVPLSDIFPNFHDVIMNYKEESETVRENGVQTSYNFIKLPYIRLNRLATYADRYQELGNLPSSNLSYDAKLGYHTYFQQLAIDRLWHQIGVPFDICCSQIATSSSLQEFEDNPYSNNNRYRDFVSGTSTRCTLSGAVPVSLLPFMAYQYIYNWYYRDSVRSPEVDIYPNIFDGNNAIVSPWVGNGADVTPSTALSVNENVNRFFNSLFQIRKRFYRKDYFNTAVGDPTVGVDSIAVPDNIVDLRKANKLQQFIEKQALAGNRIAEFIAAHWAHKADNYELGRPILISSSSQNVQISEVLQTSQTTTGGDDASAQGTRSGVGNSYGSSNGSFFVSPDYGILMINMSIVPEISYFSGTPRKLTPYRWEHFPWPEFAQIGMQPVYNFEISSYSNVNSHSEIFTGSYPVLENLDVFGYVPRYSEYKMEPDQISGELATSLRYWHQSPRFEDAPNLNLDFGLIGFLDINDISSIEQSRAYFFQYYNQIFAVGSDQIGDHCQIIGMFDIIVNRALPYNDMPAL